MKKLISNTANILGIIGLLPQIITVVKHKNFTGYSYLNTLLAIISFLLWTTLSYTSKNWVSLSGEILGLVLNLYILFHISPKSKNEEPEVSPYQLDIFSEDSL